MWACNARATIHVFKMINPPSVILIWLMLAIYDPHFYVFAAFGLICGLHEEVGIVTGFAGNPIAKSGD